MSGNYTDNLKPSDIVDMTREDVLYWASYEKYTYNTEASLKLLAFLIRKEGL